MNLFKKNSISKGCNKQKSQKISTLDQLKEQIDKGIILENEKEQSESQSELYQNVLQQERKQNSKRRLEELVFDE
ncbi:unnamed protein product [Paramecium pentaurelia]|uniref:Uncharacterized protein n=1 Tax=Paramecium pentaurelia TaxID=43138 RepID=A0A8S1YKP6_9CILI|nr:unnamed protein product [Paramecium pentaurelia]